VVNREAVRSLCRFICLWLIVVSAGWTARRPRKLYGTGQRCAEGVKVTAIPKPVVTSVLTLAPSALHRYVVWVVHELDLQFVVRNILESLGAILLSNIETDEVENAYCYKS